MLRATLVTSQHWRQTATRMAHSLLTAQALYSVEPAGNPNSTTSVLTAAALVYATGAGITAAAGTRLALQ